MTPSNPDDSPGFLLWHATLRWQRAVTAVLMPLDLTHVQFVLLACTWWLNDHGVDPNQLALAQQAGTEPKMTSDVLHTLERKGLVVRAVDETDARARKIRVTGAGAALAPMAIAAVEAVDRQFFSPVPASAALDMLRILAARTGS